MLHFHPKSPRGAQGLGQARSGYHCPKHTHSKRPQLRARRPMPPDIPNVPPLFKTKLLEPSGTAPPCGYLHLLPPLHSFTGALQVSRATPSRASPSTHPEIPTLLQVLKCATPTARASSEEAITPGDTPGRGPAGQHSPRADNFLVLMIFAAYSCVEVFFTHLRTTEKAPLEGEGGKSWDTEHGRVTQTCFRSEDRDAPIHLSSKPHTHTSPGTITIQHGPGDVATA